MVYDDRRRRRIAAAPQRTSAKMPTPQADTVGIVVRHSGSMQILSPKMTKLPVTGPAIVRPDRTASFSARSKIFLNGGVLPPSDAAAPVARPLSVQLAAAPAVVQSGGESDVSLQDESFGLMKILFALKVGPPEITSHASPTVFLVQPLTISARTY